MACGASEFAGPHAGRSCATSSPSRQSMSLKDDAPPPMVIEAKPDSWKRSRRRACPPFRTGNRHRACNITVRGFMAICWRLAKLTRRSISGGSRNFPLWRSHTPFPSTRSLADIRRAQYVLIHDNRMFAEAVLLTMVRNGRDLAVALSCLAFVGCAIYFDWRAAVLMYLAWLVEDRLLTKPGRNGGPRDQ